MDPLEGFETFPFKFGEFEHVVYKKGSGPIVIVMHEVPGITPAVAKFANKVVAAGFTVFMPSLFGTPGEASNGMPVRRWLKLCVSREFKVFERNQASPIVDWLRALARHGFRERGGKDKGVGVVGMCITGNFGLTMALDREVVAPVLSQPALPGGLMVKQYRAVHAPPEALENIRRRHSEDGLTVLGLRFQGDPLCQSVRFDTLERELGPAFKRIDIERKHAASGDRFPHSVLTKELIDEEGEPTHDALKAVLAHLSQALL